jgi:hypothetical protein
MSLFSHVGWVWRSAGEIPGPARGQLLRSFGRPLLNKSPLLYNILPAQCCDAAPRANNGPSQNNNGALLYNNASPLACAATPLSRAGALQAGITPVQCNGGALQFNGRALLDDIGAKLSSAHTKERNDALRHERAAVFRTHFTDAVHSKLESPILCPMQKQ